MAHKSFAMLALLVISTAAASTQLEIALPALQFKAQEQVRAKVKNTAKVAVTYCVEYGQWSMNGGGLETTPSPFLVQRKNASKWNTLLIGPDVGSSRHAVILDAGDSHEFPFRLNATGTIRLVLYYWQGAMPNLDCGAPPKHAKQVVSRSFDVQ